MSVLRISTRLGSAVILLGLAAIALGIALMMLRPVGGADHGDAPGAAADRAADLTDVYAFRSPANSNNLLIALGVNGRTVPAENVGANFSNDVTYTIHVDSDDADLNDNATVNVSFSGSGAQQKFSVSGLTPSPISGDVTPPSNDPTAPAPKITESGGIKAFAGQRDDAFFFDLTAFSKFVAAPYVPAQGLRAAADGAPANSFAGTNVSYIVIEVPITAVTGAPNANTGVIKAWASTSRGGAQVDRMAIPAVNTVLLPSAQKDSFNKGNPATDAATFNPTGKATIDGLRSAVDAVLGAPSPPGGPLGNLTSQQVADALIPDVVTIDFSKDVVFPNGRRLQDDVIDAALGIVLNRGGAAGVSDAINANDKAFDSTFPYLASPHQPAGSPTPTAAQLPLTGDEPGSEGGVDTGLLIALALVAGGTLMAAGVGLVLKRRLAR